MPARKPIDLHVDSRHRTRDEARSQAESSLTPQKSLPISPPRDLNDKPIAQACWRYHVRHWKALTGVIATPLDRDILLEYSKGLEYLADLEKLRAAALGGPDIDLLLKLDQRIDRKGARLDTLRSQLYLTPRSRAGVAPDLKKKPTTEPEIPLQPGGYRWDDVIKQWSKQDDGAENNSSE